MTTNRPLADTSLATESRVELVTCVTNGSGVEFVVLCADDESAPTTIMHAAAANRKASISLTIKTPNRQRTCSPGIEPKLSQNSQNKYREAFSG